MAKSGPASGHSPQTSWRVFYALILGAAVSVSTCGGRLTDLDEADSGGFSNGAGSGGVGAIGAGSSEGGSVAGGTGGTGGVGGGCGALGGSSGSGGKVVLTNAAVLAQWNCTEQWFDCGEGPYGTYGSGLILDRTCVVEGSRPRCAVECLDGEVFQCLLAFFPPLWSMPLAVNCQCVPLNPDSSCPECDYLPSSDEKFYPVSCDNGKMLCGCQ
jgi:hypothetical protein